MTRPIGVLLALVAIAIGALITAKLMLGGLENSERPAPSRPKATASTTHAPEPPARPAKPTSVDEILAERGRLDQTVWAKERKAQEYEDTFVRMWDSMRARVGDRHVVLEEFPFSRLTLKDFAAPSPHRWDIGVSAMDGEDRVLDSAAWKDLVERLVGAGWQLEYSEWHHATFDLDGGVARSTMNMKLFATNSRLKQRAVVAGPLTLVWKVGLDDLGRHRVETIDATHLTLTVRTGEDAFTEVRAIAPHDFGIDDLWSVDPVLVYDVDRDGRDDLVLPSLNIILRNHSTPGNIVFTPEPLLAHPPTTIGSPSPMISAGVIADLDGDGIPDLLLAGPGLRPTFFRGDGHGGFESPGTLAADIPASDMVRPDCITVGDVDGDGRPDLWIGQYRVAYTDGNLPDPYYDALDGYPSYLLINDGGGKFHDATPGSGLEAKRTRRNYSASFFDYDEDGRPDLITVNDFSGVDVFHNLGGGKFADATAEVLDERSAFGMSHTIADIDGDGRLDLFVTGMGSTTARRLEYMKLGRKEFPELQKYRMKMGYGNRLFLGTPDHHLRQAPFNDQVARTGWSWGCSALDVGNDGDMDLYIANGNLSRKSACDYCTRYWTQDIYMPNSQPNRALMTVFALEDDSRAPGYSWNPFEHKALLMNEGGKAFRDVAYPMDVGMEWDSRHVVTDDLDGDGRVDVIIVEMGQGQFYLPSRPVIHILRNQLPSTGHWIEVRLQDEPGRSPQQARITVDAGGRKRPALIVTGDSYRSQHAAVKHFGLGDVDQVDAVEVRWADGTVRRIEHPPIDQSLLVHPGG
jgi:hypothetical protein